MKLQIRQAWNQLYLLVINTIKKKHRPLHGDNRRDDPRERSYHWSPHLVEIKKSFESGDPQTENANATVAQGGWFNPEVAVELGSTIYMVLQTWKMQNWGIQFQNWGTWSLGPQFQMTSHSSLVIGNVCNRIRVSARSPYSASVWSLKVKLQWRL